jgi:hypothetical protein
VSAFGKFLVRFFASRNFALQVPKKRTPSSAALVGAGQKGTLRKCSPAMAGQGSQRTTVFTIEGLIHHDNNFYLNMQSLQLVV